jgi:hypothetical protein
MLKPDRVWRNFVLFGGDEISTCVVLLFGPVLINIPVNERLLVEKNFAFGEAGNLVRTQHFHWLQYVLMHCEYMSVRILTNLFSEKELW